MKVEFFESDNAYLQVSSDAKPLVTGLCIGCALLENIKVKPVSPELIHHGAEILSTIAAEPSWEDDEKITRMFACYRKFGFNPKKNRPSVAALLKRTGAGIEKFPLINSVVGVYNLASVASRLPMAAYDSRALAGAVELGVASGGEHFLGIGSDQIEKCSPGELVYRDSKGILCRGFNWRDADRSKVTDNARDITVFIDGFVTAEQMELKLIQLIDWLRIFASGSESTFNIGSAFVREV
jgi:DNA/RNA-binding domain of Phe-tRNA-synthetase-like protein